MIDDERTGVNEQKRLDSLIMSIFPDRVLQTGWIRGMTGRKVSEGERMKKKKNARVNLGCFREDGLRNLKEISNSLLERVHMWCLLPRRVLKSVFLNFN